MVEFLARENSARTIVAWQRPPRARRVPAPPRPVHDGPSVEHHCVDLLDRVAVTKAIEDLRPLEIYHCAGVANVLGSWSDTTGTLQGNVLGTKHLLEAVAAAGLTSRVLIPGSALIYRPSKQPLREGDPLGPTSPYAVSKLAQEILGLCFAEEGLQILFTRSFTHIGPRQESSYAVSSFALQIARIEYGTQKAVIKVGPLDARRDLTDVRDTVRAYQALMARGTCGKPYNVCTGHAHRIGDVLEALLARSSTSVRIEVAPDRVRPNDYPLLLGDPTLLHETVSWEPHIELPETLQALLNYWRGVVRTHQA